MKKYLLAAVAAITVVASAHAEVREAAPIGLVGEPWPPGSEQQLDAWLDPSPVITWARPEQLSGGVPSYMPAGYGVTTVPVLWVDGSVPLLPTPNPLTANASQPQAQNCPRPTAEEDARECSGGSQGLQAARENEAAGRPWWQLELSAEERQKEARRFFWTQYRRHQARTVGQH
jgi:hypothetical protein